GPTRAPEDRADHLRRSTEYPIEVAPAQTALVLDQLASSPGPVLDPAFWTGVGLFAAGAGVLAIALAQANDDVVIGCLHRAGATGACRSSGFISTGYDAQVAPTSDPTRLDSGGLLIGPFGAAMMSTGATISVWRAFSDPESAPWIELGVGLVVGALTYGAA